MPGILPLRAAAARGGDISHGHQTTVAIGVGVPHGTAIDAEGNVYVTDLTDSRVLVIERGSSGLNCTVAGSCKPIGGGFIRPTAIAVDASGTVYVADAATQSVYKVTATGTQTTLAAGIEGASGVAVAVDGTIYMSASGSIARVTAGGTVSTFATGPAQPGGIALSAAGTVFVTDTIGDRVVRISPAGGQSTVATGLNAPQALALDAGGNLYIADTGNNRILVVPASATEYVCPMDCTVSSANVNTPGGVASDANGNLYIADSGNRQLVRVTREADAGASAADAVHFIPPAGIIQNNLLDGSILAASPSTGIATQGTAANDPTCLGGIAKGPQLTWVPAMARSVPTPR